jgi:hypothetical protein
MSVSSFSTTSTARPEASILPSDQSHDTEQLNATRNSLVGQWLLFSQHSYSNALDILASEAIVPMQMLSRIGPTGHSGRQVAYPQDKWVLANAGDDISDHLHRSMGRQEAQTEQREGRYKKASVMGERMWGVRGAVSSTRGAWSQSMS